MTYNRGATTHGHGRNPMSGSDDAPDGDAVAGDWRPLDETTPLADREELVLAVADRRNADPAAVAAEPERIDDRFDVDAVYLA